MRVAFTTCGALEEPYGTPRTDPFEDLTPQVYAASEEHDGFIARATYVDDRDDMGDFARDWGLWGTLRLPSFFPGGTTVETYLAAQTLSVWRDLLSVWNFVYTGIHAAALRRRNEWFQRPSWPTYAIWWVADDHTPTWAEGVEHLELLHASGPTRAAFTLKDAFHHDGSVIDLRESSQRQAGGNRARQATRPA